MSEFQHVMLGGERFEVLCDTPGAAKFWASAETGAWEPDTVRFLKAHCRPGVVFVDIGAWIGPLSLLAARLGAKVIALEPDAEAFRHLKANTDRNGVAATLLPAALHTDASGVVLYAPEGFGQSESSTLAADHACGQAAPSQTFAGVAQLLPEGAEVVLKIDIEGHEYTLGEDIAEFWRAQKAAMHFSLHPRALWTRDKAALGDLGARWRAWRKTTALLAGFKGGRARMMSAPWAPLAAATFVQAFRASRPKNFSVKIEPPAGH